MPFYEALDRYGSDKPDTRYGLLIEDLYDVMKDLPFDGFQGQNYIRGIVVPGVASSASRKVIDEFVNEARKMRLKGLIALKYLNGELEGSFTKFMDEDAKKALIARLDLKEGDLLLFGSSTSRRIISFALGAVRTMWAKRLGLIKPNTYDLLWVVDFPMFDKEEDEQGNVTYSAEHHPFTRPRDEDLHLLDEKPEDMLAYAYDIVINGYEAGGGTLRIYDHDTQWKVFRLLGLSEEDVAKKFGWFADAFRYGAPPHGGMAYGLERLTMILCGTDNIRDVIAFPKNLQATDPTSKAPQPVTKDQLEPLNIYLKEEE